MGKLEAGKDEERDNGDRVGKNWNISCSGYLKHSKTI